EPVGADEAVVIQRQRRDKPPKPLQPLGKIEHRGVGRLGDGGLRQADLEHDQERHQEEQHQPQQRDADHQPPPPATPAALPVPASAHLLRLSSPHPPPQHRSPRSSSRLLSHPSAPLLRTHAVTSSTPPRLRPSTSVRP